MANGVREMRLDWGSVRTRDGVKPDAAVLDVFVTSEDIDTVYDAYCSIEYAAFYNRDLEEAALPLTSALIEMVCSGRCTHWGLTMATDALYEISLGQTAPWEAEAGGTGVADRCREVIRDNLPRLYQAAQSVTDDHILKLRDHHGSDRPRREPLEHLHPGAPRPRPQGTDRERGKEHPGLAREDRRAPVRRLRLVEIDTTVLP